MSTFAANRRFSVRVEHVPSGLFITLGAPEYKSERAAYIDAIKWIRSRLYLIAHKDGDFKIEVEA